jgi:hypothetical protein
MATDAYQNYVNTGDMGSSSSQDYAARYAQQQQQPPSLPSYTADVDAAVAKAQTDGKPVDESLLGSLPHSYWTRNVTSFSAHGLGKTKLEHDEAQQAFVQRANEYNAKFLTDRNAKMAAQNPNKSTATGVLSNVGEAATDFGRVAADSLGQAVGETGRLVGGGLAAIGDAGYQALSGKPGQLTDKYFGLYDKYIQTPQDEKNLAQDQAAAATRSPIAGGILGSLPSGLTGIGPAMQMVQDERNAGGSVAQQEGTLALGTVVGAGALALPGAGGAAAKGLESVAAKGLIGDAAKTAITRQVGRNVLLPAAKSAGLNVGLGAVQAVGSHVIDPDINPLTWGSLAHEAGVQAALGALLGGVHGGLSKASAVKAAGRLVPSKINTDGSVLMADPETGKTYTAAAGTPAAEAAAKAKAKPTVEGVQMDGSTVVRNATPDAQGNSVDVIPAGQPISGAGLTPASHTAFKQELGAKVGNIARDIKKRSDAVPDGNKLPELMKEATALAKTHDAKRWAQMNPVQQAQAISATAQAMNRTLHVPGVEEATAAGETSAATAVKPAAQVSETGQPDLQGDQPTVRTAGAPDAAAAAVPGMEDGSAAPSNATPEDAQKIAEQAMSDNQSPGALANLVPQETAGRTRAQATSPDEIAAHNRADAALKAGGSGLTDSNLAIMPFKSKAARLEKVQAAKITGALDTRRSDKDLSPEAQNLHDTVDTQLEPLRRNVLGSKRSNKQLLKMTLKEKVAKIKELQGQHLQGTMTPEDIRQMLEDTQAHGAAAEAMQSKDAGSVAPLPRDTPIDATHSVPLGGGVSNDGKTIYIDKRIPHFVDVLNAQGETVRVDAHDVIAHAHEAPEFPQMDERGKGYVKAHNENANTYEAKYLQEKYGVAHEAFNKALEPHLKAALDEGSHASDIPADLHTKPYDDEGKSALLEPAETVKQPKAKRGLATKKAPAPEQAAAPESNQTRSGKSESRLDITPQDLVGETLRGKVSENDITDVRALVKNAQEGDWQPLLDRVREMRADDQINAKEAVALRQEGRPRPMDIERELSSNPEELPKASDEVGKSAGRESVDPLRRETAEQVVARLRKEFAGKPGHLRAVDLFEWVLKQNPKLAELLKGVQGAKTDRGVGGSYTYAHEIIKISTNQEIPVDSLAHELNHAAERLLPASVRARIFVERKQAIARLQAGASEAEKPFFAALRKQISVANPLKQLENSEIAREELKKSGATNARQMELYSLTDPGEYWAVNASKMVMDKAAPKSFVVAAKAWAKDFAAQISNLLKGQPRRSAIAEGLAHVLSGKATEQTRLPNSLAVHEADFARVKKQYAGQPEAMSPVASAKQESKIISQPPEDTIEDASPVTNATIQREYYMNSAISAQKFDQGARAIGLDLPSVYDAVDRMFGLRTKIRSDDMHDVVEPIKQWFVDNYHQFDMNPIKSWSKLAEFSQAYHQTTERMPKLWAEEVPLENGMEAVRDSILHETLAAPDNAAAKTSLARLMALAKEHASIPFADWQAGPESLRESMTGRLKELAAEGITPKTVEPLNKLVQDMEDRTHQRRIESGKVSADDRMARARDYKWSTPQKGAEWRGLAIEDDAPKPQLNDLTSLRFGDDKKLFKPQIIDQSRLKTAAGRATWAGNTLTRAITDLGNAGTDAANKGFLSTLHDGIDSAKAQTEKKLLTETDPRVRAQLQNHESNRVSVHTFDGTAYEGFDDVATGKHYDTLPPIKNSVVHYDGRQAYILEFPKDSKVMHALQAMGTDVDMRDMPFFRSAIEGSEAVINAPIRALNKIPGVNIPKQTRLISRSTRGLSQLWTIFRPTWNVTKLLPRVIWEKSLTHAIKDSDGILDGMRMFSSSVYHIISGTFTPATGRALRMLMAGDHQSVYQLGKDNPGSWAHSYLRLSEEGGSSIFAEALPSTEENNAIVTAAKRANQNVLIKGAHNYARYARGMADMIESISSVGAYRSMLAGGMDEATAAVKTKQLMNFQKKGMATNMLSGMHGFYRVTMSFNDTMVQSFEHPLGRHEQNILGYKFTSGIDYHRLAAAVATVGAYGGLKYTFDRALMGKDEDGTSNMRKVIAQNPLVIVQNSFVPNPGQPDHPFLVATGLGFPQLLQAPGQIIAALAHGDITSKQGAEMMAETFQRNASILEPAGTPHDADMSTKAFAYALQALMPTIGQQAYPLFANVNSMGNTIHTAHPQADAFAADQGKANTPQVWKDTAQHLQGLTGVDYYPETLQYLAHNFGGPLADLLRVSVGSDAKQAQGVETGGVARTLGVLATGADYYDSTRMYDTRDELEQTQQQLNAVEARSGHPPKSFEAKQAGQDWLAGNPKAQQRLDALKALEQAQKAYQTQIKAIQASNYSPEGRRLQRKQADSALRRATDEARRTLG